MLKPWRWIRQLFSKPAVYKPGDSVQLQAGGPLMVVTEVIRPTRTSPGKFLCQWYDRIDQKTRHELFFESQIKQYDWYNPT